MCEVIHDFTVRDRVARKPYRCEVCRGHIVPGGTYTEGTGVQAGAGYLTVRFHLPCYILYDLMAAKQSVYDCPLGFRDATEDAWESIGWAPRNMRTQEELEIRGALAPVLWLAVLENRRLRAEARA